MIGRLTALVLLASTATTTALATTAEPALIKSGDVLTREKITSGELPAMVREAVTALDAKCRAAGGKPGASPNMLIMADVTHDGLWDYIIDANDYDCQGAANVMRGKEGAALAVYAGGPSNSATLIHSATVHASRMLTANGGTTLTFTDVAECGHADAVNPLNAKWEMCRRLAYWSKAAQKFNLTDRPNPWGAASGPFMAALMATAPRIAGAPPPPVPPAGSSLATYYARPAAENFAEALRLLTAAVGMGDAMSMWSLGNMYAMGQGVEKDQAKAEALWRQSAEAGSAESVEKAGCGWTSCRQTMKEGSTSSMLALARAFESGQFGFPLDKAKSDEWYRRWAKTDPPYAASTLAQRGIQP